VLGLGGGLVVGGDGSEGEGGATAHAVTVLFNQVAKEPHLSSGVDVGLPESTVPFNIEAFT